MGQVGVRAAGDEGGDAGALGGRIGARAWWLWGDVLGVDGLDVAAAVPDVDRVAVDEDDNLGQLAPSGGTSRRRRREAHADAVADIHLRTRSGARPSISRSAKPAGGGAVNLSLSFGPTARR